MPGPLADVTVVELGGIGPVPHAGMMLADMGADVIKVVRPSASEDPWSGPTLLDRGKRSMAVDLTAEEGSAVVLDVVGTAHVLIEGFRPGVAERLGVGPDQCLQRQPSLVYGRMTGWGQDGPLAAAAGHDIDYIAVAGALGAIGTPSEPVPPLNLVGDFGGGSMLLLAGVLAALHPSSTSGRGQVVDAAMVDGTAALMAMHHGAMASGWWSADRSSNLLDGAAPFYRTYRTSDGRHVAVGALEERFFAELVRGLGLDPGAVGDQMDPSRWEDMSETFAGVFAGRTRSEWEEHFAGTDACVVGVHTMDEAPEHPHLVARGTFVTVDGIRQPSPAPRFSGTPSAVPRPVAAPGADTSEILMSLGFDESVLSRMQDRGVIGGTAAPPHHEETG